MRTKNGISLIELIAVIVIMGIIAAIAIPTTVNVIQRQQKNACEASAKVVSQHYLRNAMFCAAEGDNPTELLEISLEECGCHHKNGQLYDDICPAGLCEVYLDNTNSIVINCQKHGGIQNIVTIGSLYNMLLGDNGLALDYFSIRDGGSSLDSAGGNFGQQMTAAMAEELGLDLDNYSWRIYKTKTKDITADGVYQMYLTDKNVSNLELGTTLSCTKYVFNNDGTFTTSTVSATVSTRTVDGYTFNILQP